MTPRRSLASIALSCVVALGAPGAGYAAFDGAASPQPAMSSAVDLWNTCMPQYQAAGGGGNLNDLGIAKSVAGVSEERLPDARARASTGGVTELASAWMVCLVDRREQQLAEEKVQPSSPEPTPAEIADYVYNCGPQVSRFVSDEMATLGWTDFSKDSKGRNIYVKWTLEESKFMAVQYVSEQALKLSQLSPRQLIDDHEFIESVTRGSKESRYTEDNLRLCMIGHRLALLGSPIPVRGRGKPYSVAKPKAAAPRPPAAKK
jgi:hypothetical protein